MNTVYKSMLQNAIKREEGIEVEEKKFDLVGFIMAYEDGTLDDDAAIEGFQHLIDTGMAWTLQGHYGRTAAALIEAGYCTAKEEK